MRKIIISLSVFLLVISVSLCANETVRLSHDIVPTQQLITLQLNPDEKFYEGSTKIQLQVHTSVDKFKLHSETLDILSVSLKQDETDIKSSFEQISETELEIRTETILEPGACLLEIEFKNNFDSQATSLYRLDYEGESYLYTQMEADEAREAFPCFDEPIFKIPFQLVLTVPTSDTAISNMPVEDLSIESEWKTVRFKQTPPMPSYLIAIAVGPFDIVPIPEIPFPSNVITPKGKAHLAEFAVESTAPILFALEEYFDSKYPYDKLDLIAVPEFWPGAMENAGAITYSEGILLFDNSQATSRQKLRQLAVTAHEIAHMWFGDLVTMEWWDDLWLNESFATWLGNKITDRVYPEYELDLSRVNSGSGPMISDARPSAKAIRQPVTNTTDLLGNLGAVYYKGEAVLKMFEQMIGEDNFRKGVLDYIEANKWGNATASDLWASLDKFSDFNLSEALVTFIEQPGVPLVTIEMLDENKVQIHQSRFANFGTEHENDLTWQIPMTIKYSSGSSVQTKSFLFDAKTEIIELTADGSVDWVYPNVDSRAYYRYNLSDEMLVKLAENSGNVLTAKERIGFLNNMSALLDAGKVGGGDYLKLISMFKDDENMLVLSTLMNTLGKVENAFVTDETEDQFASYVRKTLAPSMDKVGMLPKENESERAQLLRPKLLYWLAHYGKDPEVLSFAESNFKKFMDDPASVDNSLIGLFVSIGCIRGDEDLFKECKSRFETADNARNRGTYLAALGSFEDPEIQELALSYALEGPLRPQELFTIPSGIADVSDERQEYIFNWVQNNYEAVLNRMPPQYYAYLPYFVSGCSRELYEAGRIFFSKEENFKPGMDIQLAKMSDQVNDCVSLRDREQTSVEEYLKQFPQ